MVFDDFALPSCDGSSSSPATKTTPSRAAIIHSAWVKPARSSRRPPTKNPIPFIAFFEPVNQATHRNNCPLPSAEVALIADFDAVLVRSLATPAMPWAITTHATDATAPHPGSSADSISKPAIWSIWPIASMRGMPKRDAK